MDQLKPYLAALGKHHFWVVCAVVLILGVVGWRMGTSALEGEYTAGKGKIQQAENMANSVRNYNPHPNQPVLDALNTEHDQVKAVTLQLWQQLYERQSAVTTWPSDVLPSAFNIELVKGLQPGQQIQPADELEPRQLGFYRDYGYQIPATWGEKYDLMRKVRRATGPDDGEEALDADDEEFDIAGVVLWEDYETFADSYRWDLPPRTDQILVAQEDFWVYEALLSIIHEANEGATEHYEANIRQIVALDIAQAALHAPAISIETAQPPNTGVQRNQGKQKLEAPPTTDAPQQQLLRNRYVKFSSSDNPPFGTPQQSPQPGATHNLMPVRMLLYMDQRAIPKLLAACVNSPLLVEPTQVIYYDDEEERDGGGGNQQNNNNRGGDWQFEPGPYACYVDLRGVMLIINPPDTERLAPAEAPGAVPVAAAAP